MASVLKFLCKEARPYHASQKRYGKEEHQATVASYARSVYVGNLGYCTTDRQLYEFFSRVGPVENVIMGLNRLTFKPCGFCFIVFRNRSSVIQAMTALNGMLLDGCVIRIEIDKGFREGRQFGRGATGAQPQDELRSDYNPKRGGLNAIAQAELEATAAAGGSASDAAAPGINFADLGRSSGSNNRGFRDDRDRDRHPRDRFAGQRGGGGGWRGNDRRGGRGGGGYARSSDLRTHGDFASGGSGRRGEDDKDKRRSPPRRSRSRSRSGSPKRSRRDRSRSPAA